MTRIECERLVERYLEGSMDFAAEQDFFIQVALDDELRRTLKAYRVVEETIRKEREAGEVNHGAARRLVAASLITAPQSQPVQGNAPASREKRRTVRGFLVAFGLLAFLSGGIVVVDQWNAASADSLQDQVQATTTDLPRLPLHAEEQEVNDGAQRSSGEHRYDAPAQLPTAGRSLTAQENRPAEESAAGSLSGVESAPQTVSSSVAAESAVAEERQNLPKTSAADVATGSADPKIRIDSTAGTAQRSEDLRLRVEFDFPSPNEGQETHGN